MALFYGEVRDGFKVGCFRCEDGNAHPEHAPNDPIEQAAFDWMREWMHETSVEPYFTTIFAAGVHWARAGAADGGDSDGD